MSEDVKLVGRLAVERQIKRGSGAMTKRDSVAEAPLQGPKACFGAIESCDEPRVLILIASCAFNNISYFSFVNNLSLSLICIVFNNTHVSSTFAFSDK
jgi:hypothetical protein